VNYQPEKYTADQILLALGFNKSTRGYSKLVNNDRHKRYHALLNEGRIELHLDTDVMKGKWATGKHKTSKFTQGIQKLIKEMKKYDA